MYDRHKLLEYAGVYISGTIVTGFENVKNVNQKTKSNETLWIVVNVIYLKLAQHFKSEETFPFALKVPELC
jgi:hypothetical protein